MENSDLDLKSVADVVTLLETVINEVRRGDLDRGVGNTVGYLAGMDPDVNLLRSLLEGGAAALFGLLAGALLPVVLKRLRAYGVIA